MIRSCPGVFLNMPDLKMPFVLHASEVEYVRRMRKMLRKDTSSDSNVVDLSCCCLHPPFRSSYPIREVDRWGQDADFEER